MWDMAEHGTHGRTLMGNTEGFRPGLKRTWDQVRRKELKTGVVWDMKLEEDKRQKERKKDSC